MTDVQGGSNRENQDRSEDGGETLSWFGGRAKRVGCAPQCDARGMLLPFPFDAMPVVPVRAFVVSGVPAGTMRGGHAHVSCSQLLVCVQGRIEVCLRQDAEELLLTLEAGADGLLVAPGVWSRQRYLDPGSVLLVFADEPYDPASYVGRADGTACP